MNAVEQRYLKAIRSRVCHSCSDLMPDRICGLRERICPIEGHLRDIVQIAHCISGDRAGPYVRELRSTVCAACDHSQTSGVCPRNKRQACPMDKYFMLVFEAIADVHEELRAETEAAILH
ncbi:MAG: hypothetical protein PHU85_08260 [Phycisphaerae bacterium]|nr:hypothetical protein [Phycisphaerae bacterium]